MKITKLIRRGHCIWLGSVSIWMQTIYKHFYHKETTGFLIFPWHTVEGLGYDIFPSLEIWRSSRNCLWDTYVSTPTEIVTHESLHKGPVTCVYIWWRHYDVYSNYIRTWWRHQMETFSASLAICAGNSPVPGEFPAQWPVSQSFDVFFHLRLNKRLSKQS